MNILFALAAFVWLPVSAHCRFEVVPGLDFIRCSLESATAESPSNDCDECCSVEKSQYRADFEKLAIPEPDLQTIFLKPVLAALDTAPPDVRRGILTAAPPALSASWLFFSRAALPPRAPSIAS